MKHKINYTKVIGLLVFLEKRKTREFVGTLTKEDSHFIFEYNLNYLNNNKSIPLGPDLPLTQKRFSSEKLFNSFLDRIPSPDNPAYPDYCRQYNIDPKTTNQLVLLSTIGKKGPSSFVFEPLWPPEITPKDLKAFRKELELSTRDFAACFGFTQAAIVNIENEKTSGKEILKFIEICLQFPDVSKYLVTKHAPSLHSEQKKKRAQKIRNKISKLVIYMDLYLIIVIGTTLNESILF